MPRRWMEMLREVEGHHLADCALILALVTVVCAGALTLFGENVSRTLDALIGLF